MANLSKIKRDRMLAFLNKIREAHKDDDEVLISINEVENEILDKRYGLVWEEHSEEVEERMADEIPVFIEDKNKEISKANNGYNFLLEGDNLHSLHLLEKTHSGKIDVIYIDPPYNTGKEFVYDDNVVGKDDGFRHSKWLSFMAKRLRIAHRLLKDDGVIFVSINENEQAQLKLILDEIFGEKNLLSAHHIQTRYPGKDVANNGAEWLPLIEYVFIYAKDSLAFSPNLPKKEYDLSPYHFTIEELSPGEIITLGGKKIEIFKKGTYRIKNEKESGVSYLKEVWGSGSLLKQKNTAAWYYNEYLLNRLGDDGTDALYKIYDMGEDGLGYRYVKAPQKIDKTRSKIYQGVPMDKQNAIASGEGANKRLPIINFYDFSPDFGNIVNEGGVGFNSGKKPIKMLKELIGYHKNKNGTVLDFFAGSGSTGHAVMDLNKEDGGNRKFILCTNNENNICDEITYPRLKTVITGIKQDGNRYSDGIPADLKYYHTAYVSKSSEDLSGELLNHIDEMIQLEYGVKIDKEKYISILSDEDADELEARWDEYSNICGIYISRKVLLTAAQRDLFYTKDCYVIPDYYFRNELKEAGEV